ncbi:MAG: hypothetical protein M3Z24_05000 [Chloroflexota bacterium]|nr:hypothetical protein [Chloroflexota bacterium]
MQEPNSLKQWRSYSSIQRWSSGLLHVLGLTPDEVENRLDTLFQFCLSQGFDPEGMAEECCKGEDRLARRAFYLQIARETPANLIVQSFLVHNGVNVFGDLTCMPGTREQIVREQGIQWIRDRERTSSPIN